MHQMTNYETRQDNGKSCPTLQVSDARKGFFVHSEITNYYLVFMTGAAMVTDI